MTDNQKVIVKCVFQRRSFQHHSNREYFLFHNIIVDGKLIRDHNWIKNTKRLGKLHLRKGDKITFTAKIKYYLDCDNISLTKLGFTNIRNIETLN